MEKALNQPDSCSFINSISLSCWPNFQAACFLIGFLLLATKLYRLLKILISAIMRPEKDLLKRYGEGSYAVITGSSAGIGKAFCFSLARRGFNIVLIARNREKLEGVEKELKEKYPSVKTKIVVADFAESTKEGFFQQIMSQLANIDISILVNNAGEGHSHYLVKLSEEHLKNMIKVNCIPQAVLSRHLVEKFLARKAKSCIINLASFASTMPMPILHTYGATKAFNDYFSRSLCLEYPQLDIISLRPGYVDTQMVASLKNKFLVVPPEQCVEATLRELGYESVTYGHWKHKLQSEIINMIPEAIRNRGTRKRAARSERSNQKKTQ